MKQDYWILLLGAVPVVLLASAGTYGAQLTVLGLTLGIFFGTLSLRRRTTTDDVTSTNSGS